MAESSMKRASSKHMLLRLVYIYP